MTQSPPIAIIAASGIAPLTIACAIKKTGGTVFIIALNTIADADFSGFDCVSLPVGQVEQIFATLRGRNCTQVILAGKFTRPKIKGSFPDKTAAKLALTLLTKGDDTALTLLQGVCAEQGFTIIDASRFLDGGVAGDGVLAGTPPDSDTMASITLGAAVLASIGAYDIGQAVVVQGGRIIAIEGAEGTDAMLGRSRALIDPELSPAVLVKMMKTEQNRQLDPPVIGAETVQYADRAGVRVIALEAGGVLIADLAATLNLAEQKNITVIGITPQKNDCK